MSEFLSKKLRIHISMILLRTKLMAKLLLLTKQFSFDMEIYPNKGI